MSQSFDIDIFQTTDSTNRSDFLLVLIIEGLHFQVGKINGWTNYGRIQNLLKIISKKDK